MKWLKNGTRKGCIFHELFLHYIFLGENFMKLKYRYI